MSGPGLSQKDTHHAIHHAAFSEAERLTKLLRAQLGAGAQEKVIQIADILIEHWETRILAHAESEEQGLYQDIVREAPEKVHMISKLTRDHDLLRKMLAEIEGILADKGWSSGIVERFEAMLLVNAIHSRDEETFLFSGGRVSDVATSL